MKVGIVTQPLFKNYGGILQNWALQQAIKSLGHDVVTIDGYRYPMWRYTLSCVKTLFERLANKQATYPVRPIKGRALHPMMRHFIDTNIELTNPQSGFNSSVVKEYGLEAVVVGSDQVWRPKYNKQLSSMYLDFVDNHYRKIAYSASFGVDEWEYNEELTSTCSRLSKLFDAISVREASGVTLCNNYLGVTAEHVLDPTLLLPSERYEALCAQEKVEKKPFIAVYCLDIDEEKQRLFNEYSSNKGVEVRLFSAHNDISLTLEQWLATYRDATAVITDSFHGTVFSIIFRKPFYTITNKGRGETRMLSLLEEFGLTDRIANEDNIRNDINIDWNAVEKIIEHKKNHSMIFLETALSCD